MIGSTATPTEHVIGCSVAGIASTILGHPLDTVKTHLQTNAQRYHSSSLKVVQELQFGIFRGISPPLFNAILMNTVMFSVFDAVQDSVTHDPFVAGLISGFATAMISTPTDYVKIQSQLSGTSSWTVFQNTISSFSKTSSLLLSSSSPLSVMYRGHVANLAREGIFTMVYLGLYRYWTPSLTIQEDDGTRTKDSLWKVAMTSSLTGGLAWIVSYPFDTIKTLIQSGKSRNQVISIWKQSGPSAFFKGCGTSTGRAMLVTSSRMIGYEWILGVIRNNEDIL